MERALADASRAKSLRSSDAIESEFCRHSSTLESTLPDDINPIMLASYPCTNHRKVRIWAVGPFAKGAPNMIRSIEEFASAFHAARCVSTPLVAVRTADPASTTHFVIEALKQGCELPCLLGW